MRKLFYSLLFLILLPFPKVSGQVIPPSDATEKEKVQYSLLPFAGYTSDLGLVGGLLLQRFNYGTDADQPFLSNMKADVTLTTKGNFIGEFNYDRTKSFGTDIRSQITIGAERNRQSNYFGIGNQSEFSSGRYEDGFYFFENRKLSLIYSGRKTIWEFGERGRADLVVPLSVSYLDASPRGEVSQFEEDNLAGIGSGWINKAGIGLILDSRDSEFDPTRGLRYQAGFKVSPSLLGSDYTFSELSVDLRHYLQVTGNIVIAQKLRADHRLGTAPFWELSTIGNQRGLRGFHKDRFLGDSSVLHMLELRTWLFSLWEGEIKFGGQLFWDTGRVYSSRDSNRLFENWRHSFGLGGAMSVYNSDFIFRGDIGFSEESTRIYVGVGYVF